MNHEDELLERIQLLNEPMRRCMAAMSASSLKPVVYGFGEQATAAFFAEGTEILWREVGHLGASENVRRVLETTMSLPESNEDDSNKPSYYAMRALAILYYACEVWVGGDSARAVLDASLGASELCSCFDYYLLDDPIRFYTPDSLESRQKGPLESQQTSCQLRFLEVILGSEQTEESMVEWAKTKAKNLAGDLERVLPDISRMRGWVRS